MRKNTMYKWQKNAKNQKPGLYMIKNGKIRKAAAELHERNQQRLKRNVSKAISDFSCNRACSRKKQGKR